MFTQTNLPLCRLPIRRQYRCFLARRRLQRFAQRLRRRRTVTARRTNIDEQPSEVAVAAPTAWRQPMFEADAMTKL
jgi:hypothetical protein